MAKIPKEVANYYSSQSGIHKETLMEMRNRILELIPGATEIFKYSMPTFVHEGNEVAGLLANKNHIGYYPYSGSVISKFPEIEAKYTTSRGALHVPLGKPLAKSELKKLIKARISMCPEVRSEFDMSKYEEVDEEWRAIGLAAPARKALIDAKLYKVSDLRKISLEDLSNLHGMGKSAIARLKVVMHGKKITFRN